MDGMSVVGDLFGEDVRNLLAPALLVGQEQRADRVFARSRQGEAELRRLSGEELMRDLHQDSGAVAGARIGAHRAAVLEIDQDREGVFDDLMGLASLDVGDEADAAGVLVERGVVKAARRGDAGIGGVAKARNDRASGGAAANGTALAVAGIAMLLVRSCRAHPLPPHSSGTHRLPAHDASNLRADRRCGPNAYNVKLTASSPAVFLRRAARPGSRDAPHRRPPFRWPTHP